MTVPSTFATPARIIRMAMADAGYLQEGCDPTSEQYANYLTRLNDLINFWQTQGIKLWLQYDLEVPLVAGQKEYTLGPSGDVDMTKPTRVLDNGYYLDTSGNRRPLTLIARDEYMRLSNTEQTGAINSYFVDKQVTYLKVSFWPVPTVNEALGAAHLLIQQQSPHLVSLNETVQFPQEWFLALRWGLADDICTGQPEAIMERCATKAALYLDALESWDVEDASTRFSVDTRGYGVRRFR